MDPLLIVLLVVAVGGLFFVNSRGRKQQNKQKDFRSSLAPGQEVMTSSGQLGTIAEVTDETIVLETTPGVYTRWVKAAVQEIPAQFAGARTQVEADPVDVVDEYVDPIAEDPDADSGTSRPA